MHRAIAVLALLVLACGCGSSESALANTEWRLVSLGPGAGPEPVVVGSEVTAGFTPDGISGSTGCNSYSGAYRVNNGSLTTEGLSWTEAGCPSREMWVQEDRFQRLLAAVQSFEVSGDQLVISSGEGDSVLIFRRAGE